MSFQQPPTQAMVELRNSPQSWAVTSTARDGEAEDLERYHGAIARGRLRFWRLRQARDEELRPVNEYYQWWQENGGACPPYVVAFVNSRSGNQTVSQAIKAQLCTLLGRNFTRSDGDEVYVAGSVCELSDVAQNPRHVRETIRDTKRKISARALRFLVCGGDGTVTWVLQEVEACKREHPALFPADEQEPPIGIVPAGTGNDLARSLGWGARLRRVADLVGYVQWVLAADVVPLDQWKVTIKLDGEGQHANLPPAFHMTVPREYEGYFQNYFSIGMDASVTYGVERARRSALGRWCFRLGCGKVCYGVQAYRSGACLCCCAPNLSIRRRSVYVRDPTLRQLTLERQDLSPIRQLTLLNINSYGAGRVVFSPEDLATVGPADGHLELITLGNACEFGCVMSERHPAEILARPAHMRFNLERGELMQMDGESWRMESGCEIEVQRNRRVRMLRPPTCPPGVWVGRQVPSFWHTS